MAKTRGRTRMRKTRKQSKKSSKSRRRYMRRGGTVDTPGDQMNAAHVGRMLNTVTQMPTKS